MSLTPEQLDIRRSGVGASEMAAACGLSRWQSTTELYLRKRGEIPDVEPTDDMLFGTCIEAGGIDYWSKKNGTPVLYPMPTVRHPDHAHILATPDAQISPEEGLEFKTMGLWRAKQVESYGLAEIIPEYVVQAQAQMSVMGWKVVRIVALVEKSLHEWPVERNDRLINLLVERSKVFWEHVQRGIPPEIDFSIEGSLTAVQAMFREVKEGTVVQLDDEGTVMWEAYEAAGREIKKLEAQREGCKAFVLAQIGNNFAGRLSSGERMIRRKEIPGKHIAYDRASYIDCRAVNYSGEPISQLQALPEPEDVVGITDDSADTARRIDFRLQQADFLLVDTSPSGSRYYLHRTEAVRVRLSDHDPNEATAAWMERQGIVREIRIEDGREAAIEQLESVLSELEPAAEAAN